MGTEAEFEWNFRILPTFAGQPFEWTAIEDPVSKWRAVLERIPYDDTMVRIYPYRPLSDEEKNAVDPNSDGRSLVPVHWAVEYLRANAVSAATAERDFAALVQEELKNRALQLVADQQLAAIGRSLWSS